MIMAMYFITTIMYRKSPFVNKKEKTGGSPGPLVITIISRVYFGWLLVLLFNILNQ